MEFFWTIAWRIVDKWLIDSSSDLTSWRELLKQISCHICGDDAVMRVISRKLCGACSKYFSGTEESLVDWLRQYSTDKDETFIRGFLGKMLFSGTEALKKPTVLSGGEKVRCMLAKMMLSGANVIMLDGPTSHLDLESISAVNEGVKRFKGSVIFTSHDHEFIQTVANRIIEIDGGVVYDNHITYDEYIASKKAR